MEMTREYLEEAVATLEGHGFSVTRTDDALERDEVEIYRRARYELVRGTHEDIVLECLTYPDGRESYWLEIRRLFTIWSYNFELNSWKYRDDRIEFRFYSRDDGVALTFTLMYG